MTQTNKQNGVIGIKNGQSNKGQLKKGTSNLKMMLKMLLLGLFGAVVGLVSMLVLLKVGKTDDMSIFSDLGNWMMHYSVWVQLPIALIFIAVSAAYYFKGRRTVNTMEQFRNQETDLEDAAEEQMNVLEERFSNEVYISSGIVGVLFPLNFFFLAIGINHESNLMVLTLLTFMVSSICCSTLEIASIELIKKSAPRFEADPTSLKFQSQWIEKMDEAERLVMYKAAFKTFTTSKYMLLGALIIALMSKFTFDTGTFPIVIVVILWIHQTVTYTAEVMKLSKKRLLG